METIMEVLGALASVYTLLTPLLAAAKWLLGTLCAASGWSLVPTKRLRHLEHVERSLKLLLEEVPQGSADTDDDRKRRGGKWQ